MLKAVDAAGVQAACGSLDFNNVTDLMIFTNATWYGDYTGVMAATGLS